MSNVHLYQLGRLKRLGEAMIASKFEPHDNWLPPCYHVPKYLEQALVESGVPASHWNKAELQGLEQMTKEELFQTIKTKAEEQFSSKKENG